MCPNVKIAFEKEATVAKCIKVKAKHVIQFQLTNLSELCHQKMCLVDWNLDHHVFCLIVQWAFLFLAGVKMSFLWLK